MTDAVRPDDHSAAIRHELELLDPALRRDRSAVERLLAADFVEIGASGRVWDRATIITELLTGAADPGLVAADFEAQTVAPGLVLVRYSTSSPTRRVRRSSLWRAGADGWVCVFHQGTVVNEG